MIRAIENSPPIKSRTVDSRRGSKQSNLRSRITEDQQALTDRSNTRQESYHSDTPSAFLTNVPAVQSSYSISNFPNSKTTPYSYKLESLKSSCSFQLTQRRHSSKLLSLEDDALTSKIGSAKALFEQPRDFPTGYVEQEIAEFHREKLAFVYGKHNKGQYVRK
jgi:hypothetical protein